MSETHAAWGREQHAVHFDALSHVPRFVLRRSYERFNEVRLLNAALDHAREPSLLLEVGCATGEFYRYLTLRHPRVTYVGCDISRPATERACQKYPEGRFILTDVDLKAVNHVDPDVIFCRDVAHHQPDPLAFIRKLYGMARSLLVMRIRTRDAGETVRDPALSCQLNYGVWAPYIVVNSQELLKELAQFIPQPSLVRLVKHYMVLGGQHARYLPKECYFPETGTAESALLIEKGEGSAPCTIKEEAVPENLQLGFVARVVSWLARHSI